MFSRMDATIRWRSCVDTGKPSDSARRASMVNSSYVKRIDKTVLLLGRVTKISVERRPQAGLV